MENPRSRFRVLLFTSNGVSSFMRSIGPIIDSLLLHPNQLPYPPLVGCRALIYLPVYPIAGKKMGFLTNFF